jgi:subtilisin-like proprotein convertase family protein
LDRSGNVGYNADGGGDYTNSDYTAGFGGTSSAAPLVAGVMTLGKQINPDMDVRLAKHLLARTSAIVDADDTTETSDGGWRTNAAGFTFNQNYGFGNIDATAFVNLAEFASVSEQGVIETGTIGVNLAIPDNNINGLEETFEVSTSGLLEEVLVTLDIDHTYRGDLEAYLTSPSGYTSRLMLQNSGDSGNDIDWTFTSNAFWGEDTLGTWSLEVNDNVAQDVGTWNSYAIQWRTGSFITAVPEPSSTAILWVILVGSTISRRRRAAV